MKKKVLSILTLLLCLLLALGATASAASAESPGFAVTILRDGAAVQHINIGDIITVRVEVASSQAGLPYAGVQATLQYDVDSFTLTGEPSSAIGGTTSSDPAAGTVRLARFGSQLQLTGGKAEVLTFQLTATAASSSTSLISLSGGKVTSYDGTALCSGVTAQPTLAIHDLTVTFQPDAAKGKLNGSTSAVVGHVRYGEAGLYTDSTYSTRFTVPTVTTNTDVTKESGWRVADADALWKPDGGSPTSAASIASSTFTEDKSFTAQYTAIWRVDFKVAAEDAVKGQLLVGGAPSAAPFLIVDTGAVLTAADIPVPDPASVNTSSPYKFSHWTGGSLSGTAASPAGETITNATTYTAHFTGNLFTVTYLTFEGGTISTEEVVNGQSPASVPAGPERQSFTFQGWFLVTDPGQEYGSDALLDAAAIRGTTVSGPIMFKAHYKAIQYDVDLDIPGVEVTPGGGGSMDGNITADGDVTITVTPKPGYSPDDMEVHIEVTDKDDPDTVLIPDKILPPNPDGTITIPKEDIIGDVHITVVSHVEGNVRLLDFNGASGYKLLVFDTEFAADPAAHSYAIGGAVLFHADSYLDGRSGQAFAVFVPAAAYATERDALFALSYRTDAASPAIRHNGDVDGADGVDISDAQMVFYYYVSGAYPTPNTAANMHMLLEADMDSSRGLTVVDAQRIVNIILGI